MNKKFIYLFIQYVSFKFFAQEIIWFGKLHEINPIAAVFKIAESMEMP